MPQQEDFGHIFQLLFNQLPHYTHPSPWDQFQVSLKFCRLRFGIGISGENS